MQKKERGFTLVELLVSIIILGVLVSLMIPVINMSMSSGTNTSILRYQTETLQWYREMAKAKAIALATLSNEQENTAVGQVNVEYEKKYIGSSPYIEVKPSIAGWLPIFLVAPIHTNVTTKGIYVKITSPEDGTKVNPGDNINIVIEAFYVENGQSYPVDSVELYIGGNLVRIFSGNSNDTYSYTYTVPANASGSIEIKAVAEKNSLTNDDSITLFVNEPTELIVNITSPLDGTTYSPGDNIEVAVESYLLVGASRQGVQPTVDISGVSCGNPTSISGYIYTFSCTAPQTPGTYTIRAIASASGLTGEDSITINVESVFKIVDVVEVANPNNVDEILPSCISTATGNYIVVKVDNGIASLWSQTKVDYTYLGNTYTESAANAYQTSDGQYHYVFIPIPEELKNVWIPLTTVNAKAYLNWGTINRENSITLIRCCEGLFRVEGSVTSQPADILMATTMTLTKAYVTKTEKNKNQICSLTLNKKWAYKEPNDTDIIRNLVPSDAFIKKIKIEKLPDDKDKVYIGIWKKKLWWSRWKLQENTTITYPTATADVFSQYQLNSDTPKDVISDGNGYTYVEFDNINESIDNLELYSVLGRNNESCPYCEIYNRYDVYITSYGNMAYRYDTLQRYTVWFYNDDSEGYRYSPILEISPSTTCASTLQGLSITIQKNDWAYFYTSKCDYFDQVLFTVYLSNQNSIAYTNPSYIIDIFKSEIYTNTWGYTIFDGDCNEINTYYLDSSNVDINDNGMLTSITLPDIPLSDINNLNNTFYAWVKFKPTEDSADDIHVTLTITATYEANP
ncbi:Ig-like domain-containing protein [Zhurongbacter thermophilus]